MKRTRKSDAGDKVSGIKLILGSMNCFFPYVYMEKLTTFYNIFNPQKDAKASQQVNGKDSDLSKRKCSAS